MEADGVTVKLKQAKNCARPKPDTTLTIKEPVGGVGATNSSKRCKKFSKCDVGLK